MFHVSWTWKKHQEVNEARARFVDACRSLDGLTFEGGLAPRRRHDVSGFERVTARKRYRLREYLEKQGESLCAFNSPAVHDCLGWKLGEYLALGKAIVSLPLTRELPSPLEHGTHVHVVEDSCEAMAEAVERLRVDVAYRSELERNARSYWNRWLAPDQAVGRMMGTARTNRSART